MASFPENRSGIQRVRHYQPNKWLLYAIICTSEFRITWLKGYVIMSHEELIVATGSRTSWVCRILAVICLLYFAPVILVVAVLIRLTSAGPVLQTRNGYRADGQVIEVWEFRTMPFGTPEWDIAGVAPTPSTKLEIFLFVTRLFLLPRLLNISRGELSWRAAFDY